MRKNLYIAYRGASSQTGRTLFNALRNDPDVRAICNIRRTARNNMIRFPDIIIRWGNTVTQPEESSVEFNKIESVKKCAYKRRMIQSLSENENIPTPEVRFENDGSVIGNVFIRDHENVVRYDDVSSFNQRDKYFTIPINTVHEYRVHFAFGKTIGIYEKIPNNPDVKLRKNENCSFVRIDVSDQDKRSMIIGIRPIMKEVASHLDLDYFGADVVVDANRNIYVLEVNSAPSLNSLNIERWASIFKEKIIEEVGKIDQ